MFAGLLIMLAGFIGLKYSLGGILTGATTILIALGLKKNRD